MRNFLRNQRRQPRSQPPVRRLKTTSRRLPGGLEENPREVNDITRLPRFGSARSPAPPEGHTGRRRAGQHIPAHLGPPPEENALRRQKVPGRPSGARLPSTGHMCKVEISEAVGDGLRCFPSRRTRPPRRVGTEAPVIVRADNALSRLSLTPFQSRTRPLPPAVSGPFGQVFFCAYQFVFLFSLSFFLFSPRWRPSAPRRGTGLPPSTCGSPADALCPVGIRISGARRAGRSECAAVVRVGAVARRSGASSDEEDRHGRHGCHHQQFRSGRAFHRFRLLLVLSAVASATRLPAPAPDRVSIMISNSRARAQGGAIPPHDLARPCHTAT
jgi:hypothetical protein